MRLIVRLYVAFYTAFEKWRSRPVLSYMSADERDAYVNRLRKEQEQERENGGKP